jgi:hypothetical protein
MAGAPNVDHPLTTDVKEHDDGYGQIYLHCALDARAAPGQAARRPLPHAGGCAMTAPAPTLAAVVAAMHGDSELAAVIAAEAASVLRANEPAHVSLLRAQLDLRDRLARRLVDVSGAIDELQASIDAAGLGILPF